MIFFDSLTNYETTWTRHTSFGFSLPVHKLFFKGYSPICNLPCAVLLSYDSVIRVWCLQAQLVIDFRSVYFSQLLLPFTECSTLSAPASQILCLASGSPVLSKEKQSRHRIEVMWVRASSLWQNNNIPTVEGRPGTEVVQGPFWVNWD